MLGFASPYAQLLRLSFCFRGFVLGLQATKLGARLGFVGCCQTSLQHLEADVSSNEEPANEDCRHDSFVLVAPVYLGPYPIPQEIL